MTVLNSPLEQFPSLPLGAELDSVDLNDRHEAWLREQYLRDLGCIDGREAGFFDAMGAAAAQRMGGAT